MAPEGAPEVAPKGAPTIIIASPPAQALINRLDYSDVSTIGELLIDRQFECHTLEDSCRYHGEDGILQAGEKVPGLTAIPQGKYRLILAHSAKFGYVPWILDVPFFTDIRMHAGNKPEHTEGCILVGRTKGLDWVGESRLALKPLVEKLDAMDEREELWIEIAGGMTLDQFKALKKVA